MPAHGDKAAEHASKRDDQADNDGQGGGSRFACRSFRTSVCVSRGQTACKSRTANDLTVPAAARGGKKAIAGRSFTDCGASVLEIQPSFL
jgi:hypothetical protein